MSDVVITGIGALTPVGTELDALVAALDGGSSAVAVHDDLVAGRSVRAARVDSVPIKEHVRSRQVRRMDRHGRMAAVAAARALAHAGLDDGLPCADDRAAIGWGTEYASLDQTWAFQERVRMRGARLANPLVFPNLVQNAAAGYLSILFGLRGPSVTFCHHETCGLEALAFAERQLRLGRAELVLVGVSEEIGATLLQAQALIGVEIVPGEGAVALVLERAEEAAARGARALATIGGQAAASAPLPSHWYPVRDAAPRVLADALGRAGIAADGLRRKLGRGDDLVGVLGWSSVLPMLHVAALVAQGTLPSAVLVDARGGAARAVVLTPPPGG